MSARDATAITRALRDLTAGRLATTTVDRPYGTLSGWTVTTTRLLTRQLDANPDGHVIVKRRIAAALGCTRDEVGVFISPHHATIQVVAPARPVATADAP